MTRTLRFWNYDVEGLPERFRGGEAKHVLGSQIPKADYAVTVGKDGRFAVDAPKMKAAVVELTRELMTIQAKGDGVAARALLERLANVRPPVAAALALAQSGKLLPEDEVVLCITGNGLKTVEALTGALPDAPIIAPRIRELEALYGRDL